MAHKKQLRFWGTRKPKYLITLQILQWKLAHFILIIFVWIDFRIKITWLFLFEVCVCVSDYEFIYLALLHTWL